MKKCRINTRTERSWGFGHRNPDTRGPSRGVCEGPTMDSRPGHEVTVLPHDHLGYVLDYTL